MTLKNRLAGRVDLKELRHIVHDDTKLEDTLVSGSVATTNVSSIDAWTETVNNDGSTMRVRAKWDADVWVEVDDCLLMETRRWMEKTSMIVARTVTGRDGTLVTMKQFFRRYVKVANVASTAPALAAAEKKAALKLPSSVNKSADDDKMSDDASVFDQAIDFGSKMFAGLGFGTNAKQPNEQATIADIVKMFKLPAETELLSSFECSIITPSTSQSPRAVKGDKGVMYVLKYAFAFIGSDQSKRVTWLTDAMSVQELVVEGLNGIEMDTADGSKIKINCMKERDEVFDNMIAMLEMMPVTDEPTPAMDAVPNGPPLKIGFQPESYVFLHLIDVSVEGPAAKMAGTPVTTVSLGETKNKLHSTSPVPTGFGGVCSNIGQTVAISLASMHEFDGEHVSFLVHDDVGEEVGEAMLPIASLPRDTKGRAEVLGSPFAVHLSVPRVKLEPGVQGLRTKPVSKNAARGIGVINVSAWIGTSSEAAGLGIKKESDEGVVATKATVRVTPASCSVTVNARFVRGLRLTDGEPIRCVIAYGSQQAETSAASFSVTDDMTFSFGEATFNTEAPCTGTVRLEVVTTESETLLGTTEIEVSELRRRRTDLNGKVSDPPAGRYYKLSSGVEGDDEDAGLVFLQAYVDPAITYSQQQKPLLGELSVRVLRMNGIDQGIAPALIANVGDAWAFLPGFGGGGPSGWRREVHAAVRDASDMCTLVVYDRNNPEHILGKVKFSPFTLPEHGRAIVSTVPLTTKDVFGSGTENGEVTLRLQFTQTVSNVGLFFNYCTPSLPLNAYRFGDMQEVSRDLDLIKYEQLVTGRDALPEPLVRFMLDVSETDPSVSTTRRAKASAMRLASTLEVFADVLKPLTLAVTWEKPLYTAALHVAIFFCLWFPRLWFVGFFAFAAWQISLRNAPMMFTPLGENKSKLIGSVDVAKAPPGSTLSPLSSLIVAARKVSPRSTPSNDAYETIVQISFWCQAQVEFMREPMEKFAAILTWEDEGQSSKYQTMLLGAAAGFVFVPFRFVLAALIFVCLRHPWAAKIPLPPYKVALAKAIAPAPAA